MHLFSDNWPVRRWANAWVSEQKTAAMPDPVFDELEVMSTDDILGALGPAPAGLNPSGSAVQIGSVTSAELHELPEIRRCVGSLAAAYCVLGERLVVPYLEVVG